MKSLQFTNQTVTDGVLLISGAGDRSTGGGICVLVDNQVKVIDRVSTAGMILFEGRLGRLLRTPLTTGGGELLIYDARGISHYLRVDELSDPHYLIWNGQHLIVTSTGNDSLFWLTLSGEVMKRWQAPDSGGSDSWHLNDIWLVDENLYACAFGKYSSYRGYKDHLTNGDGFIFNVGSGETVAGGLCAPHSPRYFDGAWTVCDSLRNSIVQFDSQGRWQRQVQLRSFTRGLAVSEDYLVVGESIPRRTEAVLEMGSVAVLRRSDFSFVARFEVPFEEVGDVAVIPRYLVNALCKGFRTNPLRDSEADQLQLFRDVGIEPKRLWAVSERLTPDNCRTRIDASIPATMEAGQLVQIDCSVQNLSEAFLSSELPHPVNISYRWRLVSDPAAVASGDGRRTRLPAMLAPGSSIRCRIEVATPAVEGAYELILSLVQEGVFWFNDIDCANAFVATVEV